MTQGQRSRYLKLGGIVIFILLVIFFFSGGDNKGVGDLVKGLVVFIITTKGYLSDCLCY